VGTWSNVELKESTCDHLETYTGEKNMKCSICKADMIGPMDWTELGLPKQVWACSKCKNLYSPEINET